MTARANAGEIREKLRQEPFGSKPERRMRIAKRTRIFRERRIDKPRKYRYVPLLDCTSQRASRHACTRMGIAGLAGGLLASHKLAQHVARSFARREFVANLIKRLALPAPLRQ